MHTSNLVSDSDFAVALRQCRVFANCGQYIESLAVAEQLTTYAPKHVDGWLCMANALSALGRFSEALTGYQSALKLQPSAPDLHHNVGVMLLRIGKISMALAYLQHAAELGLNHPALHRNLGHALLQSGDHAGSERHFRLAIELAPTHHSSNSGLLFSLIHHPGLSASTLFGAHRQYGEQLEAPYLNGWQTKVRDAAPERSLRLGFLSADFRDHPVARFIQPVWQHLDRQQFAIHAYSNSPAQDERTLQLKGLADQWTQTHQMSDTELDSRIRADQIDILFDLSGHTEGNRLPVLARKPAPIQIGWIGYPGTSGLKAMDWRIVDAHVAQPGELDAQFTERLLFLDSSGAFEDVADAPLPNALPALTNGYLTLGSFNRPNKITAEAIRLWATVLNALPNARMLIGSMNDVGRRSNMLAQFQHLGIAAERLSFEPAMPLPAYLALHHRVDVLLDTQPFTSGTTVNHALWMGVPLITLQGDTLAQRLSAAHLRRAGLGHWVATSADAFVDIATSLPNRLDELALLRQALRGQLAGDKARSGAKVAQYLGIVLRGLWQEQCLVNPLTLPSKFET